MAKKKSDGFYIQEDYYRAVKSLPISVQNQFYGACVRFYFERKEPGKIDERARLAFELVRERVLLSHRKAVTWENKRKEKEAANNAQNNNPGSTEVESGVEGGVESPQKVGEREIEREIEIFNPNGLNKRARVSGGEVYDQAWFDKYK